MSNLAHTEFNLTTEEFAAINRVKPESVRRQIQRTGSYFNIVPKRQANGRLLFPAAQPLAERDRQPRGEQR